MTGMTPPCILFLLQRDAGSVFITVLRFWRNVLVRSDYPLLALSQKDKQEFNEGFYS